MFVLLPMLITQKRFLGCFRRKIAETQRQAKGKEQKQKQKQIQNRNRNRRDNKEKTKGGGGRFLYVPENQVYK